MDFTRREVLATAALIPVAAIKAAPQAAPAQATALDAAQRAILNAFVDRIVPRDELGAGALDAGAADYIDIQLGGYLSGEKASILEGLAALDTFAKSSQGANFVDLSAEKRDAVLTAIDATTLHNFETAVQFQFFHGLALLALPLIGLRGIGGRWLWLAAWLIAAGTLLFSGSIYAKTFGAPPGIVSVAPYGGVAIMLGWLVFAASVWRRG